MLIIANLFIIPIPIGNICSQVSTEAEQDNATDQISGFQIVAFSRYSHPFHLPYRLIIKVMHVDLHFPPKEDTDSGE